MAQTIDERLFTLSQKKYPLQLKDGPRTIQRKKIKIQKYYDLHKIYLDQFPESEHEKMIDVLEKDLVIIRDIGGCGC